MRRIVLLVTVALVMAAMTLALAMPVLAKEQLYDCGKLGLRVTKDEAKAIEKEFNVECPKIKDKDLK